MTWVNEHRKSDWKLRVQWLHPFLKIYGIQGYLAVCLQSDYFIYLLSADKTGSNHQTAEVLTDEATAQVQRCYDMRLFSSRTSLLFIMH